MRLLPHPAEQKKTIKTNIFFYFFKLKDPDSKGEDIQASLTEMQAKCLYWLECEYSFIGPESDYWSHAAIIQFADSESVQWAIEKDLSFDQIEAIQGFAVKRTIVPSFLLFLFKMLRPIGTLYLRKSHQIAIEERIQELNLESEIGPNTNQIKRHIENKRTSGAYMINLLQSYKRAQYPDGDRGLSGATAYYRRYGLPALRSVIMLGGKLVLSGRMGNPIVEHNAPEITKGPWEGIGIMMYPDPSKILLLKDMPGYTKALEHRSAGLKRTVLIISKNRPGKEN